MFAEILFGTTLAAIATCAGSLWIDRLYRTTEELSFPENISERAKFRKPILFVSLAILFCVAQNWWQVAAIFLLALMTATDFEQYMLFDAMTLPLALIGAAHAWQMNFDLLDCAAAALIGGGIFFLLALVSKGALGGGDVKLIAALGLWFGGEGLLNVVLAGTIAGGAAALLMIAAGIKRRDSYFAYGPYFALTAIYFLVNG